MVALCRFFIRMPVNNDTKITTQVLMMMKMMMTQMHLFVCNLQLVNCILFLAVNNKFINMFVHIFFKKLVEITSKRFLC